MGILEKIFFVIECSELLFIFNKEKFLESKTCQSCHILIDATMVFYDNEKIRLKRLECVSATGKKEEHTDELTEESKKDILKLMRTVKIELLEKEQSVKNRLRRISVALESLEQHEGF